LKWSALRFNAVFATLEEYRAVHGERTLGTLPLDQMVLPGQTIIFAGRRWLALSVDADARVILVKPSYAALPPLFGGDGEALHDRVADTMRMVLVSDDVPSYLDEPARDLLLVARSQFERLGLKDGSILQVGKGVILSPWVGTRRLETFGAALLIKLFKAAAGRHCIEVDECDVGTIRRVLGAMATGGPPDGASLAAVVPKPALAKYDEHLSEALLRKVVVAERPHVESVPATAARLLASVDASQRTGAATQE
jgi:ATP-dependent Lhr-like helicase